MLEQWTKWTIQFSGTTLALGILLYSVRLVLPGVKALRAAKREGRALQTKEWFQVVWPCFTSAVLILWLISNLYWLPWSTIGIDSNVIQFSLRKALRASMIIVLAWSSISLIKQWEYQTIQRESAGDELSASAHVAFQVLKMVVYALLVLSLMSIFELNDLANNVFTAGAVSTVVLGFAAREALANLFGGLMLFWDQPFKPKDYILSPDRDIEGKVEHIGWRITRVRTPKRRLKFIPNSVFASIAVENLTKMTNRRIRLHLGLRYQDVDKIAKIANEIEQHFLDWDFLDRRQGNFVTFSEMRDSDCALMVNLYTKPMSFKEYHKSTERVLLDAAKVIHAAGADFAFPTRTLDAASLLTVLKEKTLSAPPQSKVNKDG